MCDKVWQREAVVKIGKK